MDIHSNNSKKIRKVSRRNVYKFPDEFKLIFFVGVSEKNLEAIRKNVPWNFLWKFRLTFNGNPEQKFTLIFIEILRKISWKWRVISHQNSIKFLVALQTNVSVEIQTMLPKKCRRISRPSLDGCGLEIHTNLWWIFRRNSSENKNEFPIGIRPNSEKKFNRISQEKSGQFLKGVLTNFPVFLWTFKRFSQGN